MLVLEGGVDKKSIDSQVPVEHATASEDPGLLADPNRTGDGTGYWVRQYDDKEQALKDPKANADGMIWKPRGEGFGGSTRMNANVFIRVDDTDWNKLALSTGDPALKAENMKPLLEQLTKVEYRPALKFLNSVGNSLGIDALKNIGGHGLHQPLEITTADPKLLTTDPQLAKVAVRGLTWSLGHFGSPIEKLERVVSGFDSNDGI